MNRVYVFKEAKVIYTHTKNTLIETRQTVSVAAFCSFKPEWSLGDVHMNLFLGRGPGGIPLMDPRDFSAQNKVILGVK